jgi:hypothetical protein
MKTEQREWDWPPERAPRRFLPTKRTSPRIHPIYSAPTKRRRLAWWNTRIGSSIANAVLGFGILIWKVIILGVLGVVLVGCLWLLSVLLFALANGPPPHGTLG